MKVSSAAIVILRFEGSNNYLDSMLCHYYWKLIEDMHF